MNRVSSKRKAGPAGKTDLEIKIEASRAAGALLSDQDESMVDPDVLSEAKRKTAARFAHMSLPGKLGLSPYLEHKRWKHGIADGHFKCQAAFDKVHIKKIGDMESERYGDTGIIMPGTSQARIEDESPRGIITSAGIHALDAMRGAGIQVGDMVEFTRGVVSQRRVAVVNSKDEWSIRIYVGDISGCEEAAERLRNGQLKLAYDKSTGKHHYEQNGETLSAVEPFQKVEV